MESLMEEIMDLADEKFGSNDDVRSDTIHLGVHTTGLEWFVWLERPTRKHARKFGASYMNDGDVMELETWLSGEGYNLKDALNDLLDDLKKVKMKRGSGNRLVPVIEE